ncbi:MAG: low molecular weight protein-tyrosine-phosphatase [Pseudomonadota bacterium]|nr:low molecular weight protein-tyrosine-phosphatase [Pseudomonadota bacterium]
MKILMVCLGNICRSPMMEGWLEAEIARDAMLAGRVEVDSAGIGRWHVGQAPDARAIKVAARHGVDISQQRARALQAQDFERFDLILFADAATLRDGRERGRGQGGAETGLYLQWAGLGAQDVLDPYYGSEADFERAWQQVAEGGRAILARIRRGL